MTFKALLTMQEGKTISTGVIEMNERDLMPGDVSIAVDYSTVNYKDALAISGRRSQGFHVCLRAPVRPGNKGSNERVIR